MKRAFTLIELLVVIAIIAILAAILFPVFAQAKVAAKKAKSLVEVKQMGTATIIYEADYDDLMPRAFGSSPTACPENSGHCFNYWHAVPNDWRAGFSADYYQRQSQNPINSTQPYRKNYQMTRIDGGNQYIVVNETPAPGKTPFEVNYTYNGLLSSYSASGVNQVSSTPMWHSYWGNLNVKGFNISSPALYCTLPGSCTYTPATATCNGGTTNGAWTVVIIMNTQAQFGTHHIYGNGENYVYTDSSAKFKKLGMQLNGASDYRNDPWSRYNKDAKPGGGWYDQYYCHLFAFTPDWDGVAPTAPVEEVWY
ncbi:MAG: prepilin-type N-terminal cleavage/methylation domain-containing protein [Fimbriimonadaceae bacterium]|nr:MAG: prepilin-type N-terminal cleavage/methylation domain-containing protein [Fimbriimonadaceae bacterium]